MLKVGAAQARVQFAAVGKRYTARFFRHYYGGGIAGLRYAQCRTVTQTKRAGHIAVVTYRQYTAGRNKASVGHNQGAVVKRGVLEKNVLYQASVDSRVDDIARLFVVVERYSSL